MRMNLIRHIGIGFVIAATLAGCDNMREGNRLKPYEETPFFENGSTARNLVIDTVPRGFLREDAHLYQGKNADGGFAAEFPFPITEKILTRGKERFEIYCLVCHGTTGTGDGMVVRRGYKKPPSYRVDRLKNMPAGYFFDVMTHGFGVMSAYNAELTPEDRWAVAAYIRTLQQLETTAADTETEITPS
jgi:mono/diheme cytochrome c family protein